MIWLALLAGCGDTETPEVLAPEPDISMPDPALRRLTTRQYRNSLLDLYGGPDGMDLVLPSSLEPDFEFEGLASLGAALSATSPLGVERYESGARLVAEQVVAQGLPCSPTDRLDTVCAQTFVETHATQLYRRPPTAAEVEDLIDVLVAVANDSGSFETGAVVALSAMLQSPNFLYRIEHTPGTLSATEYASRLSYFLWNGPPDEALLAAAANGDLDTEEGREATVDRMLEDPRFRRGVRDFFNELMGLDGLDSLVKDPNVYSYASPELWESAKNETLSVLEDHIVDDQADYRKLFTRTDTWIDRRLAALYGIEAPNLEGFGWTEMPPETGRQGLLGHASILGLYAHPASSSATRRGSFVLRRLLCQFIPPPPADVDTSIPEATNAPTLRDRLVVHQEDPICASCHIPLDGVGFALENFDGEGRFRTSENNARIDPSGQLDEVPFSDAVGLGVTVSEHPDLPICITERVYAYAMGHVPVQGEEAVLEWLTEDFIHNGHSVRHLMRRLALSKAARVGGVQ